jgi:hypothetical protein
VVAVTYRRAKVLLHIDNDEGGLEGRHAGLVGDWYQWKRAIFAAVV